MSGNRVLGIKTPNCDSEMVMAEEEELLHLLGALQAWRRRRRRRRKAPETKLSNVLHDWLA